jgi:hypothetical protein
VRLIATLAQYNLLHPNTYLQWLNKHNAHHFYSAFMLMSGLVQKIAIVVFVIYIAFGWRFPAGLTHSSLSKIAITVSCLALIVYHPLLGVLAAIAAYKLFAVDSDGTSPTFALGDPAYDLVARSRQKYANVPSHPRFGYSLEQAVIERMAPVPSKATGVTYSWRPMFGNLHDAATAN